MIYDDVEVGEEGGCNSSLDNGWSSSEFESYDENSDGEGCPENGVPHAFMRRKPPQRKTHVCLTIAFLFLLQRTTTLMSVHTHLHGGGEDGDKRGIQFCIDCESERGFLCLFCLSHIIYIKILIEYIHWLQLHSKKISLCLRWRIEETSEVIFLFTMDSLSL